MQQDVTSLVDGGGHGVLELPDLVAPEGQPGLVLPLDEQARPPQMRGQTWELEQRGGQLGK